MFSLIRWNRPCCTRPLTTLDLSSNNLLRISSTIAFQNYFSILNVSGNAHLEGLSLRYFPLFLYYPISLSYISDIPLEIGLMEKLWNLNLVNCPLKEPLKDVVENNTCKTDGSVFFDDLKNIRLVSGSRFFRFVNPWQNLYILSVCK